MKEQKRVPKLRFEEFSGEWETKKLGLLCSKIGSGSTPSGGQEVYQQTGIPFIRSQNVINNELILDHTCIPESINSKMKGSIVKSNDILLNITGGSIGRSCVVPKGFKIGNVNQHVSIIRLKKDEPKFIQSFLASYRGQKLILRGQTGSGREGLNFQSIRGFKINIPTLTEQQKIAAFISAVDKKITQLQQKQRLLEAYKKGVMQRIFSQELRFTREDGSAYPDWEEQKMRDVAPLQRGFDLPTSKIIEGDYPVVYSNGILRKHKEFKVNAPGVITGRSGTIGQVTYINEKFWPHNTSLWVTDFKGNYPKFIYYLYHFFKLERFNAGSTVPTLNRNDVHAVKKHIPIRPEQTQIAHFLSAIDKKIAVVETQIEQTQQFKKGLLQQMFA